MSDKPSFFSKLKRRNVYKVAVAYAIVGWLLVQIATQVFPFLEIPNWFVRLVIALVAIGFPIALIIAWAFEPAPQAIKRIEIADDMPVSASRHEKHTPGSAGPRSAFPETVRRKNKVKIDNFFAELKRPILYKLTRTNSLLTELRLAGLNPREHSRIFGQ